VYSITASRAGYLTVQYGQRRPHESGRTLEVHDGQLIEHVDMALPRGGVLSGRITDELGDPFPGARVEAVSLRYTRGRRVPLQAGIATTKRSRRVPCERTGTRDLLPEGINDRDMDR
jgi:hypothetical protein